jgi:hypothetical protein
MVKERRQKLWLMAIAAIVLIAGGSTAGTLVFLSSDKQQQSQMRLATASPSAKPSDQPSGLPSASPTTAPTSMPSEYPSMVPTSSPTKTPTSSPTATPTDPPTSTPTFAPSLPPTPEPAFAPVPNAVANQITTFYAIGDVPYSSSQAKELQRQMRSLASDAEFLIHVGDLRKSSGTCLQSEYEEVASILQLSHVPVFIILGDNDFNDCPNPDEGLQFWKDSFLNFESRHWTHNFNIQHQDGRPENFAFEHKGTLFIGLNLVGGRVHSKSEWNTRLTEQVDWTKDLISGVNDVDRVVIFGHGKNPMNTNDQMCDFSDHSPANTFQHVRCVRTS